MFGKIIGGLVGGKLAQQSKNMGGTTGAMIGAAVPMIISRMSIPGMIAVGVGGYAVKKFLDKDAEKKTAGANDTGSVASIPQPKTA